ncbi:hypothetical protein [Kaarinaea lacus]
MAIKEIVIDKKPVAVSEIVTSSTQVSIPETTLITVLWHQLISEHIDGLIEKNWVKVNCREYTLTMMSNTAGVNQWLLVMKYHPGMTSMVK